MYASTGVTEPILQKNLLTLASLYKQGIIWGKQKQKRNICRATIKLVETQMAKMVVDGQYLFQ